HRETQRRGSRQARGRQENVQRACAAPAALKSMQTAHSTIAYGAYRRQLSGRFLARCVSIISPSAGRCRVMRFVWAVRLFADAEAAESAVENISGVDGADDLPKFVERRADRRRHKLLPVAFGGDAASLVERFGGPTQTVATTLGRRSRYVAAFACFND